MIEIYFITCLIVTGTAAGISFYNLLTAPRFRKIPETRRDFPFVSVLIPARNEEKTIKNCIDRICLSDYPDFEVIVYDDCSTDRTFNIVNSLKEKYTRLEVLKGSTLPEGWLGKNFACHCLSKSAKGDYFLFIDADVEIDSYTITSAINYAEEYKTGLLSIFSKQKLVTAGEKVVVPIMNWLLLTFLPLELVYKMKVESLAAANGQFMLFKKDAYRKINGHISVKKSKIEDVEFARIIKRAGFKVLTMIAREGIECRMYNNSREAIEGFAKNFLSGFGNRVYLFTGFLLMIIIYFILPVVIMPFNMYFLIIVILIAINRVIVSYLSRQNVILNCALHPFQMLTAVLTGIRSIYGHNRKSITWKERAL